MKTRHRNAVRRHVSPPPRSLVTALVATAAVWVLVGSALGCAPSARGGSQGPQDSAAAEPTTSETRASSEATPFVPPWLRPHPAVRRLSGVWKVQWKAPRPRARDVVGPQLFDVYFADAKNGWAVGNTGGGLNRADHGFILRTTNGGKTWIAATRKEWPPFASVSFVDSLNGWIAGWTRPREKPRHSVWTTGDGGKTWEPHDPLPDPGGLNAIFAMSESEAWGVGGSEATTAAPLFKGTVVHTTDGGHTWDRRPISRYFGPRTISFSDDSHGWAAGIWGDLQRTSAIFRTNDRGGDWDKQSRPGPSIMSIVALGPETCVAVGSAAGSSGALRTDDGGTTWKPIKMPAGLSPNKHGGVSLWDVTFGDARRGWIAGWIGRPSSLLLRSDDGGRTWAREKVPALGPVTAVSSPDGEHAWAVTWGGTILVRR